MKKALKLAGSILLALAVAAVAGFVVWTRAARYEASPEAVALIGPGVRTARGWYLFQPEEPSGAGFIFYPGGLVDPVAYAPLLRALSTRGVAAIIVPMPLDLAVFGYRKASDVMAAYPAITSWAIGGHSLGGAMAAQFVKENPGSVEAVAFLASYPAKNLDLSGSPIRFVTLYGTRDGLAGDEFEASLGRLPAGTRSVVIEGGNHAQFGDYGPQAGDGEATIGRAEQQAITVEAVYELVRGMAR